MVEQCQRNLKAILHAGHPIKNEATCNVACPITCASPIEAHVWLARRIQVRVGHATLSVSSFMISLDHG